MRILHLSNTPLSSSPANLVTAQNAHGHEAFLLLDRQSNLNKVFVGGSVWKNYRGEQLAQIFKNADVIHFHNFAFSQEIFKNNPYLRDIAKTKKCLIQYHSPRNSYESFEDTLSDPFFKGKKAVVAQYQVRQYPEAEFIVPNIIPIFDKKFMPNSERLQNKKKHITSSPSNIHMTGWDSKGADIIQSTISALANERDDVSGRVIINTAHPECLRLKSFSNVGIEEFMTGSYHMSFLEYLSLGVATIGNMDELTKSAMMSIVGAEGLQDCPYIQTNYSDFGKTLKILLDLDLKEIGLKSRAWMEKYWNPLKHVKTFEGVYAKL